MKYNFRHRLFFRYHWSSEIYGLGRAYRKLLNFPRFLPLFFMSDHGVNLSSDIDPQVLMGDERRYFFCWNQQIINKYESTNNLRFVPTIHPYFPLISRIKKVRTPGVGTIFFPLHNTGGYEVEGIDDVDSIKRLQNLGSDLLPVTVCLHETDFHSLRKKIFEDAGFPVIWMGGIRSPLFHSRLLVELSKHSICISEGWGSQVAFAIALGLPTTIIPREIQVTHLETGERLFQESDLDYSTEMQKVYSLFSEIGGDVTLEQQQYIEFRLGYQYRNRTLKNSLLAYYLILRVGIRWVFVEWLPQFKIFLLR